MAVMTHPSNAREVYFLSLWQNVGLRVETSYYDGEEGLGS